MPSTQFSSHTSNPEIIPSTTVYPTRTPAPEYIFVSTLSSAMTPTATTTPTASSTFPWGILILALCFFFLISIGAVCLASALWHRVQNRRQKTPNPSNRPGPPGRSSAPTPPPYTRNNAEVHELGVFRASAQEQNAETEPTEQAVRRHLSQDSLRSARPPSYQSQPPSPSEAETPGSPAAEPRSFA